MSSVRTERLLNLLTFLLNARRPVSLREMRELDEFGAYRSEDPKSGERAFERDKATLIELGVPLRWVAPDNIEDDEEGIGGYVIDRDRYYLNEPGLSPSQLALLSIAGAAAAAIEGFPYRGAVIFALAKLGFDVDETGRAPSLAHAPLEPGVDGQRVGRHLQVVHEALRKRQRLEMTYRGLDDALTHREIDPYGLYYRDMAWYLVGYCHLRGDQRTFHLGRVEHVAEVAQSRRGSFEIPADFNLADHVGRRPWEFPLEAPQEVLIKLDCRLTDAIAEIFGTRVEIVSQDTHAVIVRLVVSHCEALIETVLPYGAAAEILSPLGLRRRIAAIFSELARRYKQNTTAGAA